MRSINDDVSGILNERARELRTTKHLSIDEIAERLVLPKMKVYTWISDLPLGRPRRATADVAALRQFWGGVLASTVRSPGSNASPPAAG